MQGFSIGCVGKSFAHAGSFYMEMTVLQLSCFWRRNSDGIYN
jgi:hypothetical protein